jgi:hypothetical protein
MKLAARFDDVARQLGEDVVGLVHVDVDDLPLAVCVHRTLVIVAAGPAA